MKKKKRIYYGWFVAAVCFLMVMVTLGFGSSTGGTYLTAITDNLGLKRGLFTIGDSLRYLTSAALCFCFGSVISKIGPRKMVGFGFAFLVVSFVVCAAANTYWHFYIGGILLGAGISWTTTSVVGYIVEKWFTNSKGTVMGVILAANGLGAVLSEQIITRVIYGMHGEIPSAEAQWRQAYIVTALLVAVIGMVVVLVLRGSPEEKGLAPLGTDKQKKENRRVSWIGYEFATVLKTPSFYLSGACLFCTGFILQSMNNMSKPYMYDLGIAKEYVITIFSLHAVILLAAKIFSGALYDKYGIRIAYGLCTACAVISLAALSLTTKDSTVTLWIYTIVSSFAQPLETVLIPLTVSTMFGQKSFSKVMGIYLALNYLGYAVGVPLANAVYDAMGTYRYMIVLMTPVMAVVAVAAQFSMAAADRKRKKYIEETT